MEGQERPCSRAARSRPVTRAYDRFRGLVDAHPELDLFDSFFEQASNRTANLTAREIAPLVVDIRMQDVFPQTDYLPDESKRFAEQIMLLLGEHLIATYAAGGCREADWTPADK